MAAGEMRPWATGLCDCCDDGGSCLCGMFCPLLLLCNNAVNMGENACCLGLCIPYPYNHMLLRVKLRSDLRIEGSICRDHGAAIFCAQCALCQEAREIKMARQATAATVGYGYQSLPGQQPQQQVVVTTQPGGVAGAVSSHPPPYQFKA